MPINLASYTEKVQRDIRIHGVKTLFTEKAIDSIRMDQCLQSRSPESSSQVVHNWE